MPTFHANRSIVRRLAASLCARGLLAIAFTAATSAAMAGILSNMNTLIMSNSTAPGTISTRDRVGVFGGSFELRAPMTAVNLVAFDPPRLDAGCGGIDMYGGSFSFINSQQLVQIFRAVAANAVGLAFKAAIMAISPGLDKLMTEFQTVMQDMNKLAKNTCAMAHLVVDPAERVLSESINGVGPAASTDTGLFSDAFASLTGYLQDADTTLKQFGAYMAKAGNANVKQIKNSGASAMMGAPGVPNFNNAPDNPSDPNSLNNQVLLGFMGYEISGVPCTHENQAGAADTTAASPNSTLSTVTCTGAPTLSLKDLIDGGGPGSWNPTNPLLVYKCLNPSGQTTLPTGGFDAQMCTQMQTTTLNYPGIRAYVYTMLFGVADPATGVTADSIVGKLNASSSAAFTTAQAQYLNTIGVPMVALLSKTSDPTIRTSIAKRLAETVIGCSAAAVGQSIWRAALATQTGGDNGLSETTKANINRLRDDAQRYDADCRDDHRAVDVATGLEAALHLQAPNSR